MLVFPQLITGGSVQYPVSRTRLRRTIKSTTIGGYTQRYADTAAAQARWSIPLSALSDSEAAALQDLFAATEGRLGTFTFLDPAANLLWWSEDFGKSCWIAGAALQRTAGIADAWGSQSATRLINAGQAAQRLGQTLAVPAWFTYCFSVYARAAAATPLTLVRTASSGSQSDSAVVDATWRRIVFSGTLGGSTDEMTFAVELPAGAMVELCGAQVEAEVAPSEYMKTQGSGGVYPNARFDQDELRITAQTIDSCDTTLSVVSQDGD